ARVKGNLAPATADWKPIGPKSIGGRVTSIVCDPKNADRIWIGAAGGGVWSSNDAGKSWNSVWQDQETLNIGSLAIDPQDPKVIYCGTGEANLSVDSDPGVGIYVTKDAGTKWDLLASAFATGIP